MIFWLPPHLHQANFSVFPIFFSHSHLVNAVRPLGGRKPSQKFDTRAHTHLPSLLLAYGPSPTPNSPSRPSTPPLILANPHTSPLHWALVASLVPPPRRVRRHLGADLRCGAADLPGPAQASSARWPDGKLPKRLGAVVRRELP